MGKKYYTFNDYEKEGGGIFSNNLYQTTELNLNALEPKQIVYNAKKVSDEESDDNLDDEKEDEEEEEVEDEAEVEVETEEVSKEDDGDCLYKFTSKKKKAKNILDEFEIEDDFAEDEEKTYNTSIYVPNDKRITKKYMTIYERVRLLGERATQLSYGAKPMIKNVGNLDPKIIAKLELEAKLIPLIIIRTLPNGLKEKWRVSELEIIN